MIAKEMMRRYGFMDIPREYQACRDEDIMKLFKDHDGLAAKLGDRAGINDLYKSLEAAIRAPHHLLRLDPRYRSLQIPHLASTLESGGEFVLDYLGARGVNWNSSSHIDGLYPIHCVLLGGSTETLNWLLTNSVSVLANPRMKEKFLQLAFDVGSTNFLKRPGFDVLIYQALDDIEEGKHKSTNSNPDPWAKVQSFTSDLTSTDFTTSRGTAVTAQSLNNSSLEDVLQGLSITDDVNILILGERGAGKSTFVNAMLNYLAFDTLQDAINSDKLQWAAPCSFSTQGIDRFQGNNKVIENIITLGFGIDMRDTPEGQVASTRSMVYSMKVGSKTIRLIDTPGVGDIRGIHCDESNMEDILETLGNYDEIHGILVLLKSDQVASMATFEYCVNQLLTHLHRGAADNIVFGFTNTRPSNFKPEDKTFGRLERILLEKSHTQLSLYNDTVFSFDSEAFRYLAAYKQGLIMRNKEDAQRSWIYSRGEVRRLLSHFQSKLPHLVTNTISLNSTRQLVLKLPKLMAEMEQSIRLHIARCQELQAEITKRQMESEELRHKLVFDRVLLRPKPLSAPRLVCSDRRCIQVVDGNTQYKSICEEPCYVENILAETIGCPELINARAFSGSDNCRVCHHHWRVHMILLYDLEEYTEQVIDLTVQKDMDIINGEIRARRDLLQHYNRQIRETNDERKEIQSAVSRLTAYIKRNSIAAYNNAAYEYLEMLIRTEQQKIVDSSNTLRLQRLIQDRDGHQELVRLLTTHLDKRADILENNAATDQTMVDATMKQLSNLQNSGSNVRHILSNIPVRKRLVTIKLGEAR
jgi:predicted GTPase